VGLWRVLGCAEASEIYTWLFYGLCSAKRHDFTFRKNEIAIS
jgi:hypothetical protein